ncbi:hypothetical protein H4R18_001029 [Coemansia javaensis]|uniref:Uncharacterized protein n=1 Tax=Coemansia javaensis TaxID=2761396 RepID=A0A9W8LJR1_9FUNG|nr:hypothetical protein H4R18_001029 [Coemansia javaensis]
MERSPVMRSRLPDIFEPEALGDRTRQMPSLSLVLASNLDVERALGVDSPAAQYSRRRIASFSTQSAVSGTSTVCSQSNSVYCSDFAQSDEFLLLKDDCYDYPTDQPHAAPARAKWRHRRRRRSSSPSRLRSMVNTLLGARVKN